MLSIEQMIKIDPELAGLSETELQELRAALYEAAQLAYEVQQSEKDGSKYQVGSLTPDAVEATI